MSEDQELGHESENNGHSGIASIIAACNPKNSVLNWLLIAVPIAGYAKLAHLDESIQFIFSMVGIMPLAFLMGKATEEIATRTSESVGGLLNATFGNAAEIIIALVAVFAAASAFSAPDPNPELGNAMITLVKTSLIGSILGNLLLVMGLSFLWGGIKHKEQSFNPQAVSINTTLLLLSTICLILPTVFHIALSIGGFNESEIVDDVLMFSRLTAIVLMTSYALLLFFQLKTHSDLMSGSSHGHDEPTMDLRDAGILLLIATIFVSLMAEIIVHSVEAAGEAIGLSAVFIGVILLPLFGNAAEHFTAVVVAGKNRMDLSIGIAVGSSVQIAAFVAPLVIIVSWMMGVNLSFEFGLLETAACMLAVLIANSISRDGESNWMEGAMLLATYIIIGLAFLFYP